MLFEFTLPQVQAKLIRRYKRFLCDAELPDGSTITAHCPNPGRMTSIIPETERIQLSDLGPPGNSGRKLRYRWELAQAGPELVLVNTQVANKVAEQLLLPGAALRRRLQIPEENELLKEVKIEGSRFDFAYRDKAGVMSYLEVKQVSLRVNDQKDQRWAAFPDAVTQRGERHLRELTRMRQQGTRTLLLYVVGRSDVDAVRPAAEVDPTYAETFAKAMEAGVEMQAVRLTVSPQGLEFGGWLPVHAHTP